MRLTLLLLASLAAGPLYAADGHAVLRDASDWTASRFAPGGAYDAPPAARPATGIGYGQNLRGGINSNDARKVVSTTLRPNNASGADMGVRSLRITTRDAQDEGPLTITVRNGAGDVIGRERLGYEGKSANGRRVTTVFEDIDAAMVTVTFRTNSGPRGLGNGFSFRTKASTVCSCGGKTSGKSKGKGHK